MRPVNLAAAAALSAMVPAGALTSAREETTPQAETIQDDAWSESLIDTSFLHKDIRFMLDQVTAKLAAIRKTRSYKAEDLQYLKDLRKLFMSHDRAIREGRVEQPRLDEINNDLLLHAVAVS